MGRYEFSFTEDCSSMSQETALYSIPFTFSASHLLKLKWFSFVLRRLRQEDCFKSKASLSYSKTLSLLVFCCLFKLYIIICLYLVSWPYPFACYPEWNLWNPVLGISDSCISCLPFKITVYEPLLLLALALYTVNTVSISFLINLLFFNLVLQ